MRLNNGRDTRSFQQRVTHVPFSDEIWKYKCAHIETHMIHSWRSWKGCVLWARIGVISWPILLSTNFIVRGIEETKFLHSLQKKMSWLLKKIKPPTPACFSLQRLPSECHNMLLVGSCEGLLYLHFLLHPGRMVLLSEILPPKMVNFFISLSS